MVLKRIGLRWLRIDQAAKAALDRLLPANLTFRYILGLSLIAFLAGAGQVLIQISLDQQLRTQRYIRSLDRQPAVLDELQRVALALQLSSDEAETQRRIESIRSATNRLAEAHREIQEPGFLDALSDPAPSPTLDESLQKLLLTASQITERAARPGTAQDSALPIQDMIQAAAAYQAGIVRVVHHYEGQLEENVRSFKRIELILFLATLLVLLLEAIYVFRPSVSRLYEALRARSDFLSRMSHELRNPMNSIIGMANLLAETPMSDQQKNYISVLRRSSTGLLEILNSLLDFASIEARKMKLENVPFSLYEVLERCLDLTVVGADAVDTELTLDLAPDVPLRVFGDPIRLQQILSNLLGNAVKFTPKGNVILRLERVAESSRILIRFAVIDTGIGIDRGKLDRIFLPFVQEDSSIRRKYGGSGLGLSISKDLVERMGGRLEVESRKHRGSRFSFTLPVSPAPETEPESAFAPVPPFEAIVLKKNELTYPSLASFLERAGATSVSRVSNLVAPERTQARRIAVIDFEDIRGDLDFAYAWMNRYGADRILFLVRATASTVDIERLIAAGAGALIFKPVKPASLLEALRSVVKAEAFKPVAPVAPEPATEPVAPSDEKIRPLKVLIADDSKENQILFQAYLKSLPYELEFADNGREAFEKFRRNSFDLILMDIQMPELDGYAAVQLIRAWEKQGTRRETPILGISAYNMDSKTQSAGFSAYLVKPVSSRDLRRTILQLTAGLGDMNNTFVPPSNNSIVSDLAPTYLENRRKELTELKRIVSQTEIEPNDLKTLERIGHRLKGNALSYGFPKLGELGAKLETAVQSGSIPELASLVAGMDQFVTEASIQIEVSLSLR